MDERYRSLANDIQARLPEKLEVRDVTPVTVIGDSTGTKYEPCGTEEIAAGIGVFVMGRDGDYPPGEVPSITTLVPVHKVRSPAGLGEEVALVLLEELGETKKRRKKKAA